jgi:hypothetical protein
MYAFFVLPRRHFFSLGPLPRPQAAGYWADFDAWFAKTGRERMRHRHPNDATVLSRKKEKARHRRRARFHLGVREMP